MAKRPLFEPATQYCKTVLFIALLLGAFTAYAVPSGNIAQPRENTTYTSNIMLFFVVSDSTPLNSAGLIYGDTDAGSQSANIDTFCSGNCTARFRGFKTGINPINLGLNPGVNTIHLWANSPNNIIDTVRFRWQPREISGLQYQRSPGQIDLSWSSLSGMRRYNVYLASAPGITPQNVLTLENGQAFRALRGTSQSITGLADDISYYVRVTGIDGSGESATSTETNIPALENTLPVATDDRFTLAEDNSLRANLLSNDFDPDNQDPTTAAQTLTAQVLTPPKSGTVNLQPNGNFTYTPFLNVNGQDSFTYRITDDFQGIDDARVSLQITAINDVPVANNDAFSLSEDSPFTSANGALLINDSDVDNDPLSISTVPAQAPSLGDLVLSQNGSFTYTPHPNAFGTDTFSYTLLDGTSSSTASVSLNIASINDLPVAEDDVYHINEDAPLQANVLDNDNDADHTDQDKFQALTPSILSPPEHGSLTLQNNGDFSYVPTPEFAGNDGFTYRITDTDNATSQASVSIHVAPINDVPIATDDHYIFNEDTSLTLATNEGFLSNDADPDENDEIQFVGIVEQPQHGALEAFNSGAFNYTPKENYFGEDRFTYQIQDASGQSAQGSVILQINNVPDAPLVENEILNVDMNVVSVLDVLANDTNLDGLQEQLMLLSASAAFGSVSIEQSQTLLYTPANNFEGVDTVTYEVQTHDVSGNSPSADLPTTTGIATVEVFPPNDPPTAVDDHFSINEDTVASFDVIANDTDPENDALTLINVSFATELDPGDVETTLGSVSISDNQVAFTPANNLNGEVVLNYEIQDIRRQTSNAKIIVTLLSVNDPPQTQPDQASTLEDSAVSVNVLANDSDPEGDTLRIVNVDTNDGNASIQDESIDFTPNINFNGTASITYTVADTSNDTSTEVLSITVIPVNDAPIANDDTATTSFGQTITLSPLVNDSDPDGEVIVISGANAAYGSVSISGQTQIVYTPPQSALSTDHIDYQITDESGTSASATITVLIGDQPPVANADTYLVDGNGNTASVAASVGVLANDTDLEGVSLSASLLSSPSYASSFNLNADGSFTYVHDGSDNLADSFSYQASDGSNVDSATVTLNIFQKNLAPKVCDVPHAQAVKGQTYSYTIDIENLDEDLLTYDVTNLPSWLSFNAMSLTISGAPSDSDSSANNISIKATDTQGVFDQYIYNINLQDEFGTSGNTTVNFGANDDNVSAIIRDRVGRIILAGTSNNDFVVARLTPSGNLDTSFGSTGIVSIDLGSTETLYDVAVDKQNGVILVGQTFDLINGDAETGVVKLAENGTLDTQFDSDGKRVLDFGSNTPDYPIKVILHENTDITLIGYYHNGTDKDVFAMQLDNTGGINTNFGTSGKLSLSAANDQTVSDAVLDGENNIYIAGTHTGMSDTDFMVVQIDLDTNNDGVQDGAVNTSLGASGLFTYDEGSVDEGLAINIGSDGNILLAGANASKFWLASFTPALALNSGFASSGIATSDYFTGQTVDRATDIIQDQYGNIFLIGPADSKLGVVKFSPLGAVDTSYGSAGINTFAINGTSTNKTVGTLDGLGQVLLAGTDTNNMWATLFQEFVVPNSTSWGCDATLASANSTPAIDTLITVGEAQASRFFAVGYGKADATSVNDLLVFHLSDNNSELEEFGKNSYLRLQQGADFTVQSAQALPDGNLLVVGYYNSTALRVLKLNAKGDLDGNFANAGIQDFGGAQTSQAFDSALDSSGNLYIGITVFDSTPITRIAKLDNTGAVDTNFGSGGYADYTGFTGVKLHRGSDGALNVTGQDFSSGQASVLRFTAGGTLDTNFNGGLVTLGAGTARDIVTLGDGGIVTLLTDSGLKLTKLNTSGTLDTAFGNSGQWTLPGYVPTAYSTLEVYSSTHFLVQTENASTEFALLKLDNNGVFDATFLNAGQATFPGFINAEDIRGVTVESTGELLLYGIANNDFFLNHLNANGTLITKEFDFRFDFGFGEQGKGIAIDQQGRIVVAGLTHDESNYNDDVLLVRFSANGVIDTSFATSGIFTNQEAGDESLNHLDINALSKATVQGINDTKTFAGVLAANDSSVSSDFNTGAYATSASSDMETSHKLYRDDLGLTWIAGAKAASVDGKAHITKVLRKGGIDATFVTSTLNTTLASLTNSPDKSQWNAIARAADGDLIAVGQITLGSSQNGLLAKFDAQGNLDTGFGASGILQIGNADANHYHFYDVSIDAQGHIVTVGSKDSSMYLATYNSSGTLLYSKTISQSGHIAAKAVALDAFGGIWVAGQSQGGFELYRFKSDWTQLYYYNSREIGEAVESQDIVIDSIGNVFLTGIAQIDQEWDIFVLKYPNAVGSF